MEKVRVNLGSRSYEICIGSGILPEFSHYIRAICSEGTKIGIITNPVIERLYGREIYHDLDAAAYKPFIIKIPAGERYKTLRSAQKIYDFLLQKRFERSSHIIALGGGVIGDLAGFVAATYLRGIPYIQIPTSLVAQVDSSVGGKTGVNHPLGKNMIGAFYQPVLVWIDVDVLDTLPKREFIAGLAEVIKYGVIGDEEFFEFLERHYEDILKRDRDCLIHIVKRSCEIKARVVSQDERERGLRAILNFGHTIGHAIETLTEYKKYKHGEAVAIGMVCAAYLSAILGLCNKEIPERIDRLCKLLRLDTTAPYMDFRRLWDVLRRDKKVLNEKVRFVLPTAIGNVVIRDNIDIQKLREAIQLCYISNKS